MSNSMIDGESHSQQQPSEESNGINEGHENRIVILKKPPVDGEKHEELGSSQLSDLPLKELQGQLAAALNAQHNQDIQNREEQQRFDDETKRKNMELKRPSPDGDLFKSIEQPSQTEVSQAGQQAPEATMGEIPDAGTKQQPVEPAPITVEHNPEETNEQVRIKAIYKENHRTILNRNAR